MPYSLSALRTQYEDMFADCEVKPGKVATVEATARTIIKNRPRYDLVGQPLNIPWYVIGCIHSLEASLNFITHLYNGDPLSARTVHVPVGQPQSGEPPFTWEQSASGALVYQGWNRWHDWSIAGCLYKFESYNGFGYRQANINIPSPYLWSFSTYYVSGKYTNDGAYSSSAVSAQCGAAVILKELVESGAISIKPVTVPSQQELQATIQALGKTVSYSITNRSDEAVQLQQALSTYLNKPLSDDGYPGQNTSDAFKQATGTLLRDDPRGSGQ